MHMSYRHTQIESRENMNSVFRKKNHIINKHIGRKKPFPLQCNVIINNLVKNLLYMCMLQING